MGRRHTTVDAAVTGHMQPYRSHAKVAVYRFYNTDRQLLYVGVTNHLPGRLNEHAATKTWQSQISDVQVVWYADRSSAVAAESRAILTEHPLHNIAGRGKWLHPEDMEPDYTNDILNYIDCCDRDWAETTPFKVTTDGIGHYRCLECHNRWTCHWGWQPTVPLRRDYIVHPIPAGMV